MIILRLVVGALLVVGLAGCAEQDRYQRITTLEWGDGSSDAGAGANVTPSPQSTPDYEPEPEHTNYVPPGDLRHLTIAMKAITWEYMYATLDNFSQDAIDDYDDAAADAGNRIMTQGSDQIVTADGEWPPDKTLVKVTLTRDDWNLLADALDADVAVYHDLAKGWKPTGPDDDYAAMARESKAEASLVRRALD